MSARAGARSLPSWAFVLAAALLMLGVLAGWAVASPVGSSPDDDFHLTSVWCAETESVDHCRETGDDATRSVPRLVAEAAHCYRWDPSVSAACQQAAEGDESVVETRRGNFSPSYPPVHYAVMNLFVSDDEAASAIAMRMITATLFVALITALFLLFGEQRRRELILMWLVTTMPLGLFLLASNNPSGWAVLGVGALWAATVGYFEAESRGRAIAFGALAALSALLAAGSRGDAALFAVIAMGMAAVVTFSRTRIFGLRLLLPGALTVLCAALFATARQVGSGVQGFGGGSGVVAEVARTHPLQLAIDNFLALPGLWAGVFGGEYGLGWLDTDMPALVTFAGAVAFVMVATLGLTVMDAPKAVMALALLATLWLLPVWVLTRGADPVGEQVQPRYLLPLIVIMAGILLFTPRDRQAAPLSAGVAVPLGLLLVAAHAVALFTTIKRHTTGLDVGGFNLDEAIEWWWSTGPSPMVVLLGASAAYAGLVALVLVWAVRSSRQRASVDDAPPAARVSLG